MTILGLKLSLLLQLAWSGAFLKTFENMRKLDFFKLLSLAALLAHLGVGSMKKIYLSYILKGL